MKKIIPHMLLVLVVIMATSSTVSAGPLAPIVHKANHLRATSDALNLRASEIEAEIRYLQACGLNPVVRKGIAAKLRKKAKRLAKKSNVVAKAAFDLGYHRNNHSHGY